MGEAVLDKADCADADSSARRPQQDHQHLDRRPLARPVPVRQPGQVTSSDAATSRSGPAADGIRDLPDGGGGGRSRGGRRQLPIRGRGGLWAGVHGRRGVSPGTTAPALAPMSLASHLSQMESI